MSNTYDLGDRPRVGTYSASTINDRVVLTPTPFKDAITGAPFDPPSGVFLSVRKPSGQVTEYQYGETGSIIVRTGVGLYIADINADESGTWRYAMWSTGEGQAAEEKDFFVQPRSAAGTGGKRTLKFCVVKDGELLVLPIAPTLDSPAHQYGVARVDTKAMVVPYGTSMGTLGGGLYAYMFDEPDENLMYRWYAQLEVNDVAYYLPSTTAIVDTNMLAIGRYTDSHEIEKRFGADNMHLWLSLPGGDTDEPVDYALRAWRFINDAEEYINARLCGAFYDGDWLDPPISSQVKRCAMLLSGVFMYEARGVSDRDDSEGEPQHRLRHERDEADKMLDLLASGQGCSGNGENKMGRVTWPVAYADDPMTSLSDCDC